MPIPLILADGYYRPALLTLCEQLLAWTIQRLVPPWLEEQDSDQRERRSTDLLEWRRELGRFLAKVGLILPADEVNARFLKPIFALEDELAFSLISPIVDVTSAAGVLDPVVVAPSALPTLEACVDRILASRKWTGARRSGDLYGHDLPMIVRDVMFVVHLNADASTRFANGDWHEFGLISPILEKMARAVGDVPIVAQSFLIACERALPFVPVNWFAELAMSMVNDHGRPGGWRSWSLDGRLASVVQMIAEQGHPLAEDVAKTLLRTLDALVDMGDRRAAALQISEIFKDVRTDPLRADAA